MVTSATPPSHQRKATTVLKTRSISFLIHSCSTKYLALSVFIITSHGLSTHTQKSQ